MHSLWLPGGLAPPCRVISNGRKSLYARHPASTEAYSVRMASAQCNTSILSLQETPFGRRTNDKKMATIQLGPPRPGLFNRRPEGQIRPTICFGLAPGVCSGSIIQFVTNCTVDQL